MMYFKVLNGALSVLSWLCISALFYLAMYELDNHGLNSYRVKKDLSQEMKERRNMNLIFVGGMPRSGTTLMRTMLDAHPGIRCGLETFVIQEILNYHSNWLESNSLLSVLSSRNIYPEALDNAVAQFILEIILGHGPKAQFYCNKDPYTMLHTRYLHYLFPNSKYIFMIRDGRAFAHSVFTRHIDISGMNITDYRDILSTWNRQISEMQSQCLSVGKDVCLPVHYEKLVLQPVDTTKKIFKFFNIPWSNRVLHHEDFFNETALSDREYSTSQVKKPINLKALSAWYGKLPKDVERDMEIIAPSLRLFGYDPSNKKPDYGEPDEFVKNKISKATREKEI